jgi:hypothetical protein
MVIDHQLPGCSSSPEIAEIVKALCKAQMEFKAIKKSGVMEMRDHRYRYSTWTDICDALYPALHKNGIVFMPLQGRQGDTFVMMGMLLHGESGQWVSSTAPIRDVIADNLGIRGDSQSFEIATTYAKKTLLKAMAGGWEEGDEAQEQQAAVEQVERSKEEIALLEKVKGQLELVKGNRQKLESVLGKIEAAVKDGRLKEEDAKKFKDEYPLPEKAAKKEVAVAN